MLHISGTHSAVVQSTHQTLANKTNDSTVMNKSVTKSIGSDSILSQKLLKPLVQNLSPIDSGYKPVDSKPVADSGSSSNNDPRAKKDKVSVLQGSQSIVIDVLKNDKDANGDKLSIESFEQPKHGTLEQKGDKLVYTPDADFTGKEKVKYRIADGNGGFDRGTIVLRVKADQPEKPEVPSQSHSPSALNPTPAPPPVQSPTPVPPPAQTPVTTPSNWQGAAGGISEGQAQTSYNAAWWSGTAAQWDNNNWDVLADLHGAQIMSSGSGKYIWVAPQADGINTRWVNDHGPSASNPEGLPIKISPVAFDLNGDNQIGVTGSSTSKYSTDANLGQTVQFDIDADGEMDNIEWMNGDGDGLLVDTSKIQGSYIDGDALFGDQGGQFDNGYEKLSLHDQDGDGKLTGSELGDLGMWIDDGDAVLEDGELHALGAFEIAEISTGMQTVKNERGEDLMRADATTDSGDTIMTEDVWFGKASSFDA